MPLQFIYRLEPARPDMLATGPTARESAVVAEHLAYLQGLTARQVVLMAGRTTAPDEPAMGIVLLQAASTEEAEGIMRNDPAVSQGVMRTRLLPFRVALWCTDAAPKS
jgi:uncharacterized protein YciI